MGRDGIGAAHDERGLLAEHPAVDPQFDLGVENLQERVEVAVACRGEERFDHRLLSSEVGVGFRRAAHAPSCSTGELLSRSFRTLEDTCDFREGHAEDVVEYKSEPLGGAQRVEHHLERQPDRVGDQDLLVGASRALERDYGVGNMHLPGFVAPRALRAHVK